MLGRPIYYGGSLGALSGLSRGFHWVLSGSLGQIYESYTRGGSLGRLLGLLSWGSLGVSLLGLSCGSLGALSGISWKHNTCSENNLFFIFCFILLRLRWFFAVDI